MIDDARARELLEAAGRDVAAGSLDPAMVLRRGRRTRLRRGCTIVGVAATVGGLVTCGLWLWPGAGSGEAPVGSPTRSVNQTPGGLPTINTSPLESKDIMQALVGGVVEISPGGCLTAYQGDRPIDVLWPKGFSVTRINGTVVVLDDAGHEVVAVGSSFTAAGGFLPVKGILACRVAPPTADVMIAQADFTSTAAVVPVINTNGWKPGDPYLRAIVGGLLQMSDDGCLYVQQGARRVDILWPDGFSAARLPDGVVVVKDPAQHVVARVGSGVFGAGGNIPPAPADMACRAGEPGSGVVDLQTEISMNPR